VNKAVQSYLSAIDDNHGVREDDLFRILFPIGIEANDLDMVWLSTMNSFGRSRGKVAHKSVQTQQPIDPHGEFKRIDEQIIPGLRRLDRKIARL